MKLLTVLFSLALLFMSVGVPAAEPSPRIAELQAGLAELGYDPGRVDGLLGPKTQEAIMAFQKDQGLQGDGEYSDGLSSLIHSKRRYKQEEPQRKALLAMSDDELIKLIERASEEEAQRISWLIPERFSNLPIRSALGKWLPPDGGEAIFSMLLRLLLYPPSREGVEQFQADIGAEVTGELTLRQFQEAHRRWLRQRDTPVYTIGGGDVDIHEHVSGVLGMASAGGTWVSDVKENTSPINASEITCDRARRECLRVTAELHVPSLDDDDSLVYLSRDADHYNLQLGPIRRYRIISWSGDEIVAQENRGCDVALLTLNRNSNKVQEVVMNDEDVDPNCRNPPPPFDRPRIARLTSGWATGQEFWRKRQEVTGSYLNPRVTGEMKQLFRPSEPRGLPGPAIGPSDGTPPTAEGVLERRRRLLKSPVDKGGN